MKHNVVAVVGALILLTCIQTVQAQTTTLRYGQIPSTIKTVSALQFYIAQRKGFFARERVNLEMISIEGGAANMMAALDRSSVLRAERCPADSLHQMPGEECEVRGNVLDEGFILAMLKKLTNPR
jgi:hypothetical protein